MKAVNAKKATKRMTVASGRLTKARVFAGAKTRTKGGLKKADLMRNKNGRIVSKKVSAKSKKAYASYLAKWTFAVVQARKALGLKGFVLVKKGSPLYKKALEMYNQPLVA